MPLSNARLTTLKGAILAETDPVFVALRDAQASAAMASWYNQGAAPAELAWGVAVDRRTIDEAATYTTFDALAAGKRDLWRLFLEGAPRDMGKSKNRNVVIDVWGAATASSIAEAVLQASTRNISRAEKLLGGSTTATTGTVTAKRLTWEGPLQAGDVVDALALT